MVLKVNHMGWAWSTYTPVLLRGSGYFFQGMFYPLHNENDTLPNTVSMPDLKSKDRMVYICLSEYFFDSAMYSYYKAGTLKADIPESKVGSWSYQTLFM